MSPAWGPPRSLSPLKVTTSRITSYNVCYTKLLRLVLRLEPEQLNAETLEEVLREVAGDAALRRTDVEVRVLGGTEELAAEWSRLQRPVLAMACY